MEINFFLLVFFNNLLFFFFLLSFKNVWDWNVFSGRGPLAFWNLFPKTDTRSPMNEKVYCIFIELKGIQKTIRSVKYNKSVYSLLIARLILKMLYYQISRQKHQIFSFIQEIWFIVEIKFRAPMLVLNQILKLNK